MIESFRSLAWSTGSNRGLDRAKSWTLDRNFDQTEGERLLHAGNFVAAEMHLVKAVVDAETRKRSAYKRTSLRLLLADAQRKQYRPQDEEPDHGKLTAAEATVRAAIEIAAANSDRALYLQCLDALAEIFADQGNYSAVERVMQEAIKLEAALARPDPLTMGRRVQRLGIARHRLGRADEALPALEKAVKLHEETYGPDHDETANQLAALGAAHRALGNHSQAQELLRRALKIHEQKGLDSSAAIADLHGLAGSLEECGDLEGAAEEYERALAYKQRIIGSDLDDLAELQYGLASLHIEWENFARARELLYESIGTFRRRGGLRLCVAYETMAHIEECSGRYNDAVRELTLAGGAWEQMNPPRPADLIRNLERRAELLDMLRKRHEAEHLRERIDTLQSVLAEEQGGTESEETLANWPLDENTNAEESAGGDRGAGDPDAAVETAAGAGDAFAMPTPIGADPEQARISPPIADNAHNSGALIELLLKDYHAKAATRSKAAPPISMPRPPMSL